MFKIRADIPMTDADGFAEVPSADQVAFSRRDWAVVAVAAAEAVLWSAVFWPPDLLAAASAVVPGLSSGGVPLPGVGLSLAFFAGFAAVIAIAGRNARIDRTTVPLLVACAAMGLFPAIYGDGLLRKMNVLVLWPLGTYTMFLVAGIWPGCGLAARSFAASIGRFFSALFGHLALPVRAARTAALLREAPRGGERAAEVSARRRAVAAGVGIAVALLAVALPLLASADAVFGSLFGDAWGALAALPRPDELLGRVALALAAGPFLFGLLWGFARGGRMAPAAGGAHGGARLQPVTASIALAALDAVYALFAVVQFVYLFGGAESAAMAGGYAAYARSGFFQLVAVAAVNVCVGLAAVRLTGGYAGPGGAAEPREGAVGPARVPRSVRALVCALVALTFVILASAAWRMSLYVGAYGLTLLRCLTYLGMAFAAVLLVTLAAKALRPATGFFRVFLLSGAALWIAFNVADPDAIIASYNVDSYLAGSLEELDVAYLDRLSPDADPVLERLRARSGESGDDGLAGLESVVRRAARIEAARGLPWQMQCLAYWR